MASQISLKADRLIDCNHTQDAVLKLPDELLEKILSYLDARKDIESAALVCRRWNRLAVRRGWSDTLVIKKFAAVLASKGDEFLKISQKAAISSIESRVIPVPSNLLEVSGLIFHLRVDLLNILKDLNITKLNALKLSFPVPLICANLFSLANFCRQVAIANMQPINRRKIYLEDVFKRVIGAKEGKLHALEIAETVSDVEHKSLALKAVSEELFRKKKVDQAIQVAATIPEQEIRTRVLVSIANRCIKDKKPGQALAALNKISDKQEKRSILGGILEKLVLDKKPDEAIEIADAISDEEEKNRCFSEIASNLLDEEIKIQKTWVHTYNKYDYDEDGCYLEDWRESPEDPVIGTTKSMDLIEKSLEVARKITDIVEKVLAIRDIFYRVSETLIDDEKIELYIEIVKEMSVTESIEGQALSRVCDSLISRDWLLDERVHKALDIADIISDDRIRTSVFEKIFKTTNIEQGLRVTHAIESESLRNVGFSVLAKSLIEGNWECLPCDIERSLEIADLIPDEAIKKRTLVYIATHEKNIDQALAIIDTISDEEIKNETLSSMFGFLDQDNERVDIYLALEIADSTTDVMIKDKAFNYVARRLAEKGLADEALSVASKIASEIIKIEAIEDVCCVLVYIDLERALTIISAISDEKIRDKILSSIYQFRGRNKDVDVCLALGIADSITDEMIKNKIFKHIATILAERKLVDEALGVASKISDEIIKIEAIEGVCYALYHADESLEQALTIVSAISNGKIRGKILSSFCPFLIRNKDVNLDRALEIANSITDAMIKDEAFKKIATRLATNGLAGEALSVASKISDEAMKIETLVDMSFELSNDHYFRDTLMVARAISDEGVRLDAMMDLCVYWITVSLGLWEISNEELVLSKDQKNQILRRACMSMIYKNVDEAIQIADEITDKEEKNGVFVDLSNALLRGKKELGEKITAPQYKTDVPSVIEAVKIIKKITDKVKRTEACQNIFDRIRTVLEQTGEIEQLAKIAKICGVSIKVD